VQPLSHRTPLDTAAFDSLGGLVVVLEPGGAIVYWNRACSELIGRGLDEVRGQKLWEFLPVPEEAARLEEAIRDLLTSRRPGRFETTWALVTGERRTVALATSLVPGGSGDVELLVLTGVDITDIIADRESGLGQLEALLEQAPDGIFDSERRWLRAVLDIVPMGILFFEPDGRLYFNRRTEELLGMALSPSGGSAQYADNILFPDGRPVPCDQLVSARVLRAGETMIGEEYLIARPDGSRIAVLCSGAALRDPEGRVAGGIIVFQDTSERMRGERALRLGEERLRVALQASPAVVFNQDMQLRYTWIHNPKQPFKSEQVLGKTDFDLLPSANAEQLAVLKRGVLESGVGARTIVHTTIAAEVHYYDLTVEPLRDHAGRIVGITCATWDVTDHRRAEQEQRFLAEAGEVLLNAAPDYEQMLTQLARLAVRELADWFLVDIVEAGRVRRLRVAHSDPTKAALARALEEMPLDRQRPHFMFEPLQSGKTKLVTEVSAADIEPLGQSDEHLRLLRALEIRSFIAMPLVARGNLLGAFALISSRDAYKYHDRDLRFAEEFARLAALAVENAQLYEATQRAIAARDEVLGIVAHDLRNPLNIVLLQSELLRTTGAEPERRSHGPANTIRRAALRMNRLIQDMLDVARLEAGSLAVERTAVATRSLLDEVFQTLRDEASKAGLHLRLHAAEQLPDLCGDRDRLLQVFDNLISNAIKFTPSGGDIVLGAEPKAGEVLFRVMDTGSGIAPEHIPRLFDPFWQATKTDRRGAGLGLSIVKGLIEAHDGRIWVESQIGKGSTFYFTVPLAPRAQASPAT
jgi:PAS domain S-box-containing protein